MGFEGIPPLTPTRVVERMGEEETHKKKIFNETDDKIGKIRKALTDTEDCLEANRAGRKEAERLAKIISFGNGPSANVLVKLMLPFFQAKKEAQMSESIRLGSSGKARSDSPIQRKAHSG